MIIKTIPDKEKVKSMLILINNRKEFVSSIDFTRFPTNATETYYEIIKELITSILLLDGVKAIGEYAHKEMIEELSKYKEFEESEIRLIDDLRVIRNKSSYEGREIQREYLDDRRDKLVKIIEKLEILINKKLK